MFHFLVIFQDVFQLSHVTPFLIWFISKTSNDSATRGSYKAVKLDVIFDFMWKIINFAKYLNSWFLDHCIFPDTPLHITIFCQDFAIHAVDTQSWIYKVICQRIVVFCLISNLVFLHFFEFKSTFISRVVERSWPPTAYLSRQHSFIYPPCICRNKFVFFVANPYFLWQFRIYVLCKVLYCNIILGISRW